MKRNFIFAAILLASLSMHMVNAIPHKLHKRGTAFKACPNLVSPPTAFNIIITPDPPVAGGAETFTVSGTPSVDITAGSRIVTAFVDTSQTNFIGISTGYFCSTTGIRCPVTAGTPFSGVTHQATVPATLPDKYVLLVSIMDVAKNTTSFCASADVATPPATGGPPAAGSPPTVSLPTDGTTPV